MKNNFTFLTFTNEGQIELTPNEVANSSFVTKLRGRILALATMNKLPKEYQEKKRHLVCLAPNVLAYLSDVDCSAEPTAENIEVAVQKLVNGIDKDWRKNAATSMPEAKATENNLVTKDQLEACLQALIKKHANTENPVTWTVSEENGVHTARMSRGFKEQHKAWFQKKLRPFDVAFVKEADESDVCHLVVRRVDPQSFKSPPVLAVAPQATFTQPAATVSPEAAQGLQAPQADQSELTDALNAGTCGPSLSGSRTQ